MATKKKTIAKKKTTKQRLDDILNIAAEELIGSDDEPFKENTPVVTAAQLTTELQACEKTSKPIVPFVLPNNDETSDFEFARATLYQLSQKAMMATDLILEDCEEMHHPRTYEVAGQLLKITAEITKEIITLRKTQAELNKFKLPGEQSIPTDIKNTSGGDTYILQATTAEVLEAIKKAKEPPKSN